MRIVVNRTDYINNFRWAVMHEEQVIDFGFAATHAEAEIQAERVADGAFFGCPYCGDPLEETWSACCGEAGHGEYLTED